MKFKLLNFISKKQRIPENKNHLSSIFLKFCKTAIKTYSRTSVIEVRKKPLNGIKISLLPYSHKKGKTERAIPR